MENSNNTEKIKILYLDDEEFNLHAFKATFRFTYQVFVSSNAAEALKIIGEQNIQIVVSDQRMPDVTGVEFLKMVVEKYPTTKRILLTGYSDQNDTVNAINIGKISKFVNKPWDESNLNSIFQELYAQYLEELETKEKADKLEDVAKERDLYKEESDQIEFMLRQKLLED